MTVTWRLVSTAGTWGWVRRHALSFLVKCSWQHAAVHLQWLWMSGNINQQCNGAEGAVFPAHCWNKRLPISQFLYLHCYCRMWQKDEDCEKSCVNWAFKDMCTSLIFAVWSAPGQGRISTLPSCLFFPYLFLISSPAWHDPQPVFSLFFFRSSSLSMFSFMFSWWTWCSFIFSGSLVFCISNLNPLSAHPAFSVPSLIAFPLSFKTREIWGIYQQTWSCALLCSPLLCVEMLIRGFAWQRSPKPASFKSTDVPSDTNTHTNPLQVYKSFIDALLQSAQLLHISSTAERHST